MVGIVLAFVGFASGAVGDSIFRIESDRVIESESLWS
jgi:hypothetical protein